MNVMSATDCAGHTAKPNGDKERHLKRVKRGKYAIRACAQCQIRKVRCVGGTPCNACLIHDRDCVAGVRVPEPPIRGRINLNEVLHRLRTVERQVECALGSSHARRDGIIHTRRARQIPPWGYSPEPDVDEDERQVFAGEASVIHALQHMEENVEEVILGKSAHNHQIQPRIARSEKPPLLSQSQNEELSCSLLEFGVALDENETGNWLQRYFDEVHILYPFLHELSVRQSYEMILRHRSGMPLHEITYRKNEKSSMAIVFLCLAAGRCSETCISDVPTARRSAGWSLYKVASYLLEELLSVHRQETIASLSEVQALLLIVVYLFRLDAHQRAERVLGQVIVNAHMIGLHRQAIVEKLTAYGEELACRTLWCIFVLERRICLNTGRPFTMQEANIDTRLPLELSDDWLDRHQLTACSMSEVKDDVLNDLQTFGKGPVAYLNAMISYSKIVGDVWNFKYGSRPHSTPRVIDEYIALRVDKARKTLPPFLVYNAKLPANSQLDELEWWQIKQCALLHMRYLVLRLLVLQTQDRTSNNMDADDFYIATMTVKTAADIVSTFTAIPDRYPKYSFPLPYHIINAMVAIISTVARYAVLKDQCCTILKTGLQVLQSYCKRTWVSGKAIRIISRLHLLATTLMPNSIDESLRVLSAERVPSGTTAENRDWDIGENGIEQMQHRNNENGSVKVNHLGPEHLPTVNVPSEIPSSQVKDTARFDSANLRKMPSPWASSIPATNSTGTTYGSTSDAFYLSDWSMPDLNFERSPYQSIDDIEAIFGQESGEDSANFMRSLGGIDDGGFAQA